MRNEPQMDVQELVEFLAGQVVDNAGAVEVERRGQSLMISVGEGEEGRLIGRGGRVIQAIRTVARAGVPPRARLNIDLASGHSDAHRGEANRGDTSRGKGR